MAITETAVTRLFTEQPPIVILQTTTTRVMPLCIAKDVGVFQAVVDWLHLWGMMNIPGDQVTHLALEVTECRRDIITECEDVVAGVDILNQSYWAKEVLNPENFRHLMPPNLIKADIVITAMYYLKRRYIFACISQGSDRSWA